MPDMNESARGIVVGVTGASGALYAVRTVAALMSQGCSIDLVISDFGKRLIKERIKF